VVNAILVPISLGDPVIADGVAVSRTSTRAWSAGAGCRGPMRLCDRSASTRCSWSRRASTPSISIQHSLRPRSSSGMSRRGYSDASPDAVLQLPLNRGPAASETDLGPTPTVIEVAKKRERARAALGQRAAQSTVPLRDDVGLLVSRPRAQPDGHRRPHEEAITRRRRIADLTSPGATQAMPAPASSATIVGRAAPARYATPEQQRAARPERQRLPCQPGAQDCPQRKTPSPLVAVRYRQRPASSPVDVEAPAVRARVRDPVTVNTTGVARDPPAVDHPWRGSVLPLPLAGGG